jgi:hypothetical protein
MVDLLKGPLEGLGRERLLHSAGMTPKGLITYYVLFVISMADRVVPRPRYHDAP